MTSIQRDVPLYLTGASLSYIGSASVPVVLSFAVLDSGHGAGSLGLVLAAQTAPVIVLVLFGGIAGDRWSRRRIMIAADLFRASAQALLAASLLSGRTPLALIVAVSALVGIGNSLFQPASAGFLTEIAARERLARTNGILLAINALAMVIGPEIGGAVVISFGPGWGIALDAGSYIASACCLLAIRPQPRATAGLPHRSVAGDIIAAVRSIGRTRWLCLLVIQYGLLNMLAIAPFNVLAPVILLHMTGRAAAWGTVLSSIGLGAIVGALACSRRQPRKLLLGVEAASLLLTAPLFLLAMRAPLALVAGGGVMFGIGAAVLSVLTITAIQAETDQAMLSRTMAIVQLVNLAPTPLGYLLAGPALAVFGASTSLGLSGLCVLAIVAGLCSQPEIRRFELRRSRLTRQ